MWSRVHILPYEHATLRRDWTSAGPYSTFINLLHDANPVFQFLYDIDPNTYDHTLYGMYVNHP